MAAAMARARRALSTWRFSIIRPSTVITPLPSAMPSSHASMTRCECSTSASVGENALVARLDLGRVDERLAVEAHLGALDALGSEPLGVLHVVVHAVEDDLAGERGLRSRIGRGPTAAGARPGHQAGPKLFGQVVGAHDEHGEAFRRRGDLDGALRSPPASRASPRSWCARVHRSDSKQRPRRGRRPRRELIFGTTTAGRAGGRRGHAGRPRHHSVSRPLMRIVSSRSPVLAAAHRGGDLLAGDGLHVGRDRVLGVEDDGVGTAASSPSRAPCRSRPACRARSGGV